MTRAATPRPTRRLLARVGLGVLSGALAMLLVGAAPAAAEDTPAASPAPAAPVALEATPTPAIGKVGTESRVTGRGWPAGAQVQVSVCGNNALNGSADCDPKGSRSTSAAPDGTFIVTITFTRPPKPCPCVVHAYSPQTTQVVNYPVEIAGLPTATPVKDSSSRAATVAASIDGSGPWTAWFGGAASRELVLSITNTGTLPINELPMTVYLGKGEDPTEFLTQARSGQVAPGETTQVVVPFELPALSFGSYTARTVIDGLDQQVTARADTSTYPWALLVVAWLVIQIPLLGLHRRRQQARFDDTDLLELEDPFSGLPGSSPAAPALVGAGLGAAAGAGGAAAPAAGGDLGGMAPWAAAMVAGGAVAGGAAAGGAAAAPPTAAAVDPSLGAAGPAAAAVAGAAASRVSVSGSGGSVVSGADSTYGVSHVRAYLDPASAGAAAAVAASSAGAPAAAPGVPAGVDPVFAAALADPAYQAATAAALVPPAAPVTPPVPAAAAPAVIAPPPVPAAPPVAAPPVAAPPAPPAPPAPMAPPSSAASPFGSPFVAAPPPAPAPEPPVAPAPPAEPVWTVPAGADPLDPTTPLQPPTGG